jgi:hypothetical protein
MALNIVDLPTLGSPTIPHRRDMVSLPVTNAAVQLNKDAVQRLPEEVIGH